MFAILLSKGMDPFYQNISSFPTLIFSFILAICLLYWLLAVFGIVDLDIINLDGLDAGFELGSEVNTANAIAGVMLKVGLHGVPVTIIISFLSLFGWLLSYYSVHFLSPFIPQGLLYYLFGLVVLIVTFWIAVLLTALMTKLLRPFFQKIEQQTTKHVLGQSATVRSSTVTHLAGEAFFNDGGAGLILKVRASDGETFVKGDKVVLLEYRENDHIYHVISEQDFNT